MMKRRVINSYTTEGREAIHKKLGRNIDTNIMHYLMRNPIPYRSAAYNDNRISLYCAQFGKCAITGVNVSFSLASQFSVVFEVLLSGSCGQKRPVDVGHGIP